MQQEERELIEAILGIELLENRESTAQLALKSAEERVDDKLSLLLYLICLEQFGNLFCVKKSDSNGIIKVLQQYSTQKLNDRQLAAIKNLRNSLCHHFGLVCNNKYEKKIIKITNSFFLL